MRPLLPVLHALAIVLFAGLASCASPERRAPVAVQGRSVPVVRGTGERATWEELVAAAAGADAVLIGENHGHPLGLAAAAALWDDIIPRTTHAALALEFFERDEQSRLDDYLTGVTDEPTFRKRTARTASNYPPGHRAMVEAAKAAHRPVIAANAPRPYVHLARTDGYERLAALTPAQRAMFRLPDVVPGPDSRYRLAFEKAISGEDEKEHDPTPPDPEAELARRAKFDAPFRSHSVWDWTMAESVARALEKGDGPVVLVVGRFHVDFKGGLVQALERLRPGTRTLVVSFVDSPPPGGGITDKDPGRGDYVIYVGPSR